MADSISRPLKEEYPEWFAGEIELVHYDDLLTGLEDSFHHTQIFLQTIPEEKLLFRYQPEKWTIMEIWQHVLDVERILCYRALRYARMDATVLNGFDENAYALSSRANKRAWGEVLSEYEAVRRATITLFKSFESDMLLFTGITNRSRMTVRSAGFLILGNEIHHVHTISERYLFQPNEIKNS